MNALHIPKRQYLKPLNSERRRILRQDVTSFFVVCKCSVGGGGGALLKLNHRVASRRPPSCSVYIWSATKYGTEAALRTADQTRDSDYSKFPELKYFGMSSSVFHPFC